jgi:hypothetical protein
MQMKTRRIAMSPDPDSQESVSVCISKYALPRSVINRCSLTLTLSLTANNFRIPLPGWRSRNPMVNRCLNSHSNEEFGSTSAKKGSAEAIARKCFLSRPVHRRGICHPSYRDYVGGAVKWGCRPQILRLSQSSPGAPQLPYLGIHILL